MRVMGFGRDRPPREMHKATCGDCGNECEVPFEPRQDKPVYCGDCFQNHKPERRYSVILIQIIHSEIIEF